MRRDDTDDRPTAVVLADDAYETIKALAGNTLWAAYPGPDVYQVLGNLKLAAGPIMADALRNLSAGLGRTLEDANYDVCQDDGTDPGIAVMNAADCMNQAAEKAAEIGQLLEAAQGAINRQGYNRPPPQHGDQVTIELPDRTTLRGTWQHVEGRGPYLLDDDGTKHTDYTQPSGPGRRNIIERADAD